MEQVTMYADDFQAALEAAKQAGYDDAYAEMEGRRGDDEYTDMNGDPVDDELPNFDGTLDYEPEYIEPLPDGDDWGVGDDR